MKSRQHDQILRVVHESIQSLCKDIDKHRSVITSILEGGSVANVESGRYNPEANYFVSSSLHSRELRLKKAIQDAIEVLDESRKAFKSKQLEALRRQLTQVLVEAE